MAETSTYKPKGTVLSPYEDSALLKLKSVTQPVLEEFKTSGKVDANALNQLAKTQNANLTEIVKYMLAIINQQSDTTTDKLKSELKSLANSLVTDLKASKDSESEKENIDNKPKSDDKTDNKAVDVIAPAEKTDNTALNEDTLTEKVADKLKEQLEKTSSEKDKDTTISELKKEFATQEKDDHIQNEKQVEKQQADITANIKSLQSYVSKQLESLKKNITGIKIKLPKITLPKLPFPKPVLPKITLPKLKLPKLELPKFKLPKLKLPKLELPKFKLPKLKLFKLFNKDKNKAIDVKLVNKIKKEILKAIDKTKTFQLKHIREPILHAMMSLLGLSRAANKNIIPDKSKKKKHKPSKLELSLTKMIAKVNSFIDNFFDNMLSYVDAFLDKVLKSAKRIVNKLMTHILAWLLVNVVLLGIIFALILKFIAKPLMDILKPIMDFIDNIVGKILTFLEPVRDFLIRILEPIFKAIGNVFVAFFNGIASIADALGKAIGKLVIGIADFMVDTLLPFLRDHLLPVLAVVLDIVKEFFTAIKPWIKPLVDTVLGILQTLLEAIEPWIKPLVDVILSTLVAVMDILKRLIIEVGEILIDIAKIIHAPIKIIADFFDGFGTNAKKIGEKVSEIALEIADIVLEIVKELKPYLIDIINTIRLYVIAPLNGLKRWITSQLIQFKNTFWVPKIGFEWGSKFGISFPSGLKLTKYYVFLKSESEWNKDAPNAIADPDASKPISELVSDEMSKMQDKIAAEKEAQEAAELAKKLQQKQIEDLLNNQHKLDDILVVAKDNNTKLVDISSKLGLDVVKLDENVLSPETLDDVKDKITIEDLNKGLGTIVDFLRPFADTTRQNFELILQKLDEKPSLMPIPLMNTDAGSTALLENY